MVSSITSPLQRPDIIIETRSHSMRRWVQTLDWYCVWYCVCVVLCVCVWYCVCVCVVLCVCVWYCIYST